jgi:hypothetical protein
MQVDGTGIVHRGAVRLRVDLPAHQDGGATGHGGPAGERTQLLEALCGCSELSGRQFQGEGTPRTSVTVTPAQLCDGSTGEVGHRRGEHAESDFMAAGKLNSCATAAYAGRAKARNNSAALCIVRPSELSDVVSRRRNAL